MKYQIYAQVWHPVKGDSRGTIEEVVMEIEAENDMEAGEKLINENPTTQYARFDMPDINDVICSHREVGIDFS